MSITYTYSYSHILLHVKSEIKKLFRLIHVLFMILYLYSLTSMMYFLVINVRYQGKMLFCDRDY